MRYESSAEDAGHTLSGRYMAFFLIPYGIVAIRPKIVKRNARYMPSSSATGCRSSSSSWNKNCVYTERTKITGRKRGLSSCSSLVNGALAPSLGLDALNPLPRPRGESKSPRPRPRPRSKPRVGVAAPGYIPPEPLPLDMKPRLPVSAKC